MLGLYNAILSPLRPIVALWAFGKSRNPERREEWAERRARRLPRVAPGGLWLHGSSVGEARIVEELARALRADHPERPLVVSAFTATGRASLPGPPVADAAFFLPLDFRGYASRVLQAVRPTALILVETEIWPNLLRETHDSGVPVLVLNGRLADDRMSRYRRFEGLYRPLLSRLARVGAQSVADADRFASLGVPEAAIEVTGNVKYDLASPRTDPASSRRRFGLEPDRPVFVAGSTGDGEDALVLDAFLAARREHPRTFLILAPRHPRRVPDVETLLERTGLAWSLLSSGSDGFAAGLDAVLVDTIGELSGLYGIADVAFVGGSLVPLGGHNLLEPAAAGAPVLFGPHVDSVTEPAAALLRAGGGLEVRNASSLGAELSRLLADDSARREMATRAEQVVLYNRGALEHSLALVRSVVEPATVVEAP